MHDKGGKGWDNQWITWVFWLHRTSDSPHRSLVERQGYWKVRKDFEICFDVWSIFHTVCKNLENHNNGGNIIFIRYSPPIHHISFLIDIVSLLCKCSCYVICNVVVGVLVLIKDNKRKHKSSTFIEDKNTQNLFCFYEFTWGFTWFCDDGGAVGLLLFAVTKTGWRFRNNITVATLINKVNYSCTENLNEEEKILH